MRDRRLLRHPGIKLLQRAIRREQYQQLIAFSLMLLVGIVCCWLGFYDQALITIAGLIFTILGVSALVHLYKNWNNNQLMQILRYQPRRVVWVYSVVVENSPFGIHLFKRGTLFIKMIDGTEISLALPARKLKLAAHTLGRLLPHAAIGYSKERENQYQRNPKLLLREKEGGQ